VGGESTRPPAYGLAEVVSAEEEIRRVAPVIERLAARVPIPISVDTRKAPVALAAIAAGASIVNDITALRYDPDLAGSAAAAGVAVVLMHMRGIDPRTMQDDVVEGDAIGEIVDALRAAADRARADGIPSSRIAIDPGLGFGKTANQNLALIARLPSLSPLGFPISIGASRKGFVAKFSGIRLDAPPSERLAGSLACVGVARAHGAAIVRVHDVAATVGFLDAMRRGAEPRAAAERMGVPLDAFEKMDAALRRAA
jgi:dihydropteroate synthase